MKYTAVVLSVADVKAARGFYEDLFGLEVCQDYGINVSLPAGSPSSRSLTGWWGCRRSGSGKRATTWSFALRRRTWTIFWSS